MDKITLERANEEAKKAFKAFEQADESYRKKAARYISAGPVDLSKPMPRPEALLNFTGLSEMDRAWRRLEQAEAKLRQAFIQLASAHFTHYVKPELDQAEKDATEEA